MQTMMWSLVVVAVAAILYLWAVMPRIIHRPDRSKLMGHDYAHRGLHDLTEHTPENSMKAFVRAVNAGYGIELDVQLTKDRIPVVFHDADLKRVCNAEGKVRDYTYEELCRFTLCDSSERIPTMEECLKMVAGKVPLIIEIKAYEKAKDVCVRADRLLAEYTGTYCVESFDPRVLLWYRVHRPGIVRGQLSCAFYRNAAGRSPVYFLLQHLLTDCIGRPDFIAYDHHHKENLSRRIACNLFGALSVAWTIRSEKELAEAAGAFELFIFEGFIPEESGKIEK